MDLDPHNEGPLGSESVQKMRIHILIRLITYENPHHGSKICETGCTGTVVNTRGYREIILIFSLDLKSIFVYKQFD